MERLVANISGRVQRRTLHGRPHLVVPMSMVVPGVLNGSQGPLLYELTDIRRDPAAWNGMPVVVYHPQKNGQQVSARDPDVLEKQQVGIVLDSRANGKLTAQAWLDEERLRLVDRRVLDDLNLGRPVEISTGLYVEQETKEGTYNGKRYKAIARNYRPDHLAILPDEIGACSVADGCGLLVNKKYDLQLVANVLSSSRENSRQRSVNNNVFTFNPTNPGGLAMAELTGDDRSQMIEDLIGNCDGCWNEDQREILESFSDEQLTAQHRLLENAMSAKEKKKSLEDMSDEELENELKNRRKTAEPAKNQEEFTPPASAEDWFRNAPQDVQETFKVAANIEKREKDALIDKLTANLSGPEKSIHRERLQQRSLSDLQEDLALLPKVEPKPEPEPAVNQEVPAWAKEAAAIARTGPKVLDDEPLGLPVYDWTKGGGDKKSVSKPATPSVTNSLDPSVLAQLPDGLQALVRNAAAIERRQREEIIQQIVSNVEGNERYRLEDRLSTKSIDELKDILLVRGAAPVRKPNYSGAATPLRNSSLSDDDENDVLPLPTMDYAKRA